MTGKIIVRGSPYMRQLTGATQCTDAFRNLKPSAAHHQVLVVVSLSCGVLVVASHHQGVVLGRGRRRMFPAAGARHACLKIAYYVPVYC